MAKGTFLNVDLEIRSELDLSALLDELGSTVIVLHHGRLGKDHLASVELADQRPKTADAVIRSFIRLLSSLRPEAAESWRQARSRVFDIGIQAGSSAPHHLRLSKGTLAKAVALGVSISITTYAPER